jgi:hypothetical protein
LEEEGTSEERSRHFWNWNPDGDKRGRVLDGVL